MTDYRLHPRNLPLPSAGSVKGPTILTQLDHQSPNVLLPGSALGNGNLQPISSLLQGNQNYLQHMSQQRSQLISQLPMYHHREPLATPPEDPMGLNASLQHPNGYYYQHQAVV